MKPTQVECAKGALNQLPPWTTISGDIRLTPFYDAGVVMKAVEGYVQDLNDNIETLPTRGPWSKYTLEGDDVDIKRGKLELTWSGTPRRCSPHGGHCMRSELSRIGSTDQGHD